MRIGIDIGGTHTDAVLVASDDTIMASCKVPTTKPLNNGVGLAIRTILDKKVVIPDEIEAIFIGTTAAVNAVLEEEGLLKVGLIRIAGQNPALRAGFQFPPSLRKKVISGVRTIGGGFECFGASISTFEKVEAEQAIEALLQEGAEAFAIVGVFSPLYQEQERKLEELIRSMCPKEFPISLSSDIAGLGFYERENATILNSSLKKVMHSGFQKMKEVAKGEGLSCPLFMVQNDGSLMDIDMAGHFPLLTLACGQTNSFRGGARLSGLDHLLVIDVGGTSCDIGFVKKGEPVRSIHAAKIGGVKVLSSLPDVASLAYGGGTIVGDTTIGPKSVGAKLLQEAQCFGGATLTLTDLGALLGYFNLQGQDIGNIKISAQEAKNRLKQVHNEVLSAISLVQGKEQHVPCVVVGGGAPLLQDLGFILPESYGFANAYGAALAEVSHTIDRVCSLVDRDLVLDKLKEEAQKEALIKGAKASSLRITNVSIMPYGYAEGAMGRVIVTCQGKRKT
jgi:N-methylhydantoinase A/oxoprolinase/acetone carboxylase beta subunit